MVTRKNQNISTKLLKQKTEKVFSFFSTLGRMRLEHFFDGILLLDNFPRKQSVAKAIFENEDFLEHFLLDPRYKIDITKLVEVLSHKIGEELDVLNSQSKGFQQFKLNPINDATNLEAESSIFNEIDMHTIGQSITESCPMLTVLLKRLLQNSRGKESIADQEEEIENELCDDDEGDEANQDPDSDIDVEIASYAKEDLPIVNTSLQNSTGSVIANTSTQTLKRESISRLSRKIITIVSIIMNHRQPIKSNYLQVVFGLFSYQMGTKKRILELLNKMGITASYRTVRKFLKDISCGEN